MTDEGGITRADPLRHTRFGIPVLNVSGEGLALIWEKSLLELWNGGCHIETEYDADGDPPSVDATMTMTVLNPMSEPAIHRCFPGGLADLEEYRMEFIEGIKDQWVKDPSDPDYAGEWTYTYSQRLRKYECYATRRHEKGPGAREQHRDFMTIDQVAAMIDGLVKSPHSRRQQCVTWQPWIDMHTSDPPCCQSIWMRINQDNYGTYVLNGNFRFRSRDAYGAAFMNLWAEVAFMEMCAGMLQARLNRPVRVGRLFDISDSYHIYGKNIAEFKERFFSEGAKRSVEDRTWTRAFAQPFFDEARPAILAKIAQHDAERRR
jgi:thymidylate synthase